MADLQLVICKMEDGSERKFLRVAARPEVAGFEVAKAIRRADAGRLVGQETKKLLGATEVLEIVGELELRGLPDPGKLPVEGGSA